jgi:beta-N-acetylhexosaminidase
VVEEAIGAVQGRAATAPERLAALRGAVASTWEGLTDNPQRDRFIARITALHPVAGQPLEGQA